MSRSRKLCKCWDGSEQRQHGLPVENVPELVSLGRGRRAGTLGRQSVQAGCLRPCKRHPCLLRPTSRRCGNARLSGRSPERDLTRCWTSILGRRRRQVNEADCHPKSCYGKGFTARGAQRHRGRICFHERRYQARQSCALRQTRRFAGLETRNRRTLCRNKPLADGFLMFGMRLAQPNFWPSFTKRRGNGWQFDQSSRCRRIMAIRQERRIIWRAIFPSFRQY